jgi:hypothetical protein
MNRFLDKLCSGANREEKEPPYELGRKAFLMGLDVCPFPIGTEELNSARTQFWRGYYDARHAPMLARLDVLVAPADSDVVGS